MRVLWLSPIEPPAVRRRIGGTVEGGAGSWITNLLTVLMSRGDVDLVIASPGDHSYDSFSEDGVTYYNVERKGPTGGRARRTTEHWLRAFRTPEETHLWLSVIEAAQPDLIHIHGTEHPQGLVLEHNHVPAVVSLQGLMVWYARAHYRGVSVADVARLAGSRAFLRGNSQIHTHMRMQAMARRELRVMRAARFVIGRTDWDHAVLAAVNPSAHYFHCDEVMRPDFYRVEWKKPQRVGLRTVYSTGSDLLFKGTECVVEGLRLLHDAGFTGVHLRVAGLPPGSQVHSLVLRRAKRLAIDHAITWLGRLDGREVSRELLNADLFAYASHADNSPNSVVEAMLVGVPIVASYVGGIPSLVDPGEEGLLFPDGDPYALAAQMCRLLLDEELAATLGRRARQRALVRNDPDAIAEQMVAIYSQVLELAGTLP